jgi:hypothetical protein
MANPLTGLLDVDATRAARAALRDPVGRLLDRASGTTLDLSPVQQLAGGDVTWAPRRSQEPTDRTFDTVVSVLRTTTERSLDGYADRLAALLDPAGGRLLFVEPTRTNGVIGGLQRVWRPATEVSANLRLHRGFRLALWRAGLSIIEVSRHELPRWTWPITSVAVGVARHTPAGARRGQP